MKPDAPGQPDKEDEEPVTLDWEILEDEPERD